MERLERYVMETRAFRNDLIVTYCDVSDADKNQLDVPQVFEDIKGYGAIYNSLLKNFSIKSTLSAMNRFYNDKYSRCHAREFLLSFITHLYSIVDKEVQDKSHLLDQLKDIYDDETIDD